MKIIAYVTSRLTALFPYEEVLPLVGVNDRDIIDNITTRYKFLKSPNLVGDETSKNGFRFEQGQITLNDANERIADFSIYRDGIVINASKTDISEALLDDITGYMKESFSFRDPVTKPRRYFQSQIVVEFERSPERLIVPFNEIAANISQPLEEIYGVKITKNFARLDLGVDKARLSLPTPATVHAFIVERRTGVPFENERYFCSAPMRTATHVSTLERIEKKIP
jgi:hypothetical protein